MTCIKQEDLKERGAKILRMRSIYQFAQFFFWLGPAVEDSDVAVDLIDSLARGNVMAPRVGAVGTARDLDEERHQRFADIITQDEGSMLVYALVMPINRKSWTRVWVLQEAVVATSVEFVCGRQCPL